MTKGVRRAVGILPFLRTRREPEYDRLYRRRLTHLNLVLRTQCPDLTSGALFADNLEAELRRGVIRLYRIGIVRKLVPGIAKEHVRTLNKQLRRFRFRPVPVIARWYDAHRRVIRAIDVTREY